MSGWGSSHHKNVCEFGMVHSQCRCPAADKTIVHITCDRRKEHDPHFLESDRDDGHARAAASSLGGARAAQGLGSQFGPVMAGIVSHTTEPTATRRMFRIPPHQPQPVGLVKNARPCEFLAEGMCYWCCDKCNTDSHRCGGCGISLDHNGMVTNNHLKVKHTGCTD